MTSGRSRRAWPPRAGWAPGSAKRLAARVVACSNSRWPPSSWATPRPRADGGCALFLVDASQAGVLLRGRKLLDRTRSAADLTFAAAPGLRAAVLVAADSLGAAARMLELAVDYSKQRKQFGVPIGSFQAMKHAAATMLVSVEASRSIAYFAAASVEQERDGSPLHAAAAKAQVSAAGERAADAALTMHGAIGYTWEHDLQLFYKRAKLNAQLYGSPEVW